MNLVIVYLNCIKSVQRFVIKKKKKLRIGVFLHFCPSSGLNRYQTTGGTKKDGPIKIKNKINK